MQTSTHDIRLADLTAGGEAVRIDDAVRVYGRGDTAVRALDGVTRRVRRAGTLHRDHGPVRLRQVDPDALRRRPRPADLGPRCCLGGTDLADARPRRCSTKVRRERIGFVFQSFNLLAAAHRARENITLPMRLAGADGRPRSGSTQLVRRVGLPDRLRHRPAELSGGQQQRVADGPGAGRAGPRSMFADEPTGDLDSRRAARCSSSCATSVDDIGQTVVMVTHDPRRRRTPTGSCCSRGRTGGRGDASRDGREGR